MRVAKRTISISRTCLASIAAICLGGADGCHRGLNEPMSPITIDLMSNGISDGMIDKAYTCDGQGLSLPLSWGDPPVSARTLAIVVTDRDAPLGFDFVHWVVYNIPPNLRSLPAGLPRGPKLSNGAEQGNNDNDKPGYTPPCPRGKPVHRYDVILYALDSAVSLPSASKKQLLDAIRDHVIARGELIGHYGH